ncbi:MAG TPA: hypothetical protein VFJ94_00145 [Intrasporangium sp.]|uniref:hypothetical protein n=1 Tax=Intrasporangium sp. TaxID=1925024 RepID=UPI002D77E445|nr:hypothetical protein [Intrasporangium sp.]HET7396905.1 hypothetical protein [Intrasporangium sp.]
MSPKSKGRPKGRGRAQPKRRPPAAKEIGVVDRVLRGATRLSDLEDEVVVQMLASSWVGLQLADAGFRGRHPERSLAGAVAERLTGEPGDAAYRALLALRTLTGPEDTAYIDELLAGHRHVLPAEPPWAHPSVPQPREAWRVSDPWGSEISYVVAYDAPQPHELLAHVSTVGGLLVSETGLVQPGYVHELAGYLGEDAEAIEPGEALARIHDAITMTDLYFPPMWGPESAEARSVVLARARPYAVEHGAPPIADDARRELLDAFALHAAQVVPSVPAEVVEVLADTFIDFGDGYLPGGVLAWSPGEVERFLLDWVLRKVVLDPADWQALPDVLAAWVEFALRRRNLDEDDIAVVVATVGELTPEFRDAAGDESSFGPGAQVLRALQAQGADLTDRAALEQAVRAYNAGRLAEIAFEGQQQE